MYVILFPMHKDFYASGFLYHPPSQQILLQQSTSIENALSQWLLFGAGSSHEENPETTFQKIIFSLLAIELPVVYPVYFHPYENTQKNHYIVYAKVRRKEDFSGKNGMKFGWFSFRQILKMRLAKQTEHDITVGIRVIDAATRKRLGEHTFE